MSSKSVTVLIEKSQKLKNFLTKGYAFSKKKLKNFLKKRYCPKKKIEKYDQTVLDPFRKK